MDEVALSREDRALALERIRQHLQEESGEEVGDLKVIMLYDFIAERIGPLFYNEGLNMAQQILRRGADSLDADMDAAKRYEAGARPSRTPPEDEEEPEPEKTPTPPSLRQAQGERGRGKSQPRRSGG
jgi:uncharacterized protein (DUF2164 family)